jgi:hypothetical protein
MVIFSVFIISLGKRNQIFCVRLNFSLDKPLKIEYTKEGNVLHSIKYLITFLTKISRSSGGIESLGENTMRRAKRIPIESLLKKGMYPEIPTKEKLKTLTENKDTQQLVLVHVGLAIAIASKHAAKFPNMGKDILSQALLVLIECIDRYVRGETKHNYTTLPQYLHLSIDKGVLTYIKRDHNLVRPPINSKWLIELYHINPDCLSSFSSYEYVDDQDSKAMQQEKHGRMKYKIKEKNPISDIEINDILESDFFNTVERKVLKMRWEGYTDLEISQTLGMSKMGVNKMRAKMRERIDYLLTGKKMSLVAV